MRKVISVLALIAFYLESNSQSPDVEWEDSFGGSSFDEAYSIDQLSDGSYIVGGATYSEDGNVNRPDGRGSDNWILKLNGVGNIVWKKYFGGTENEQDGTIVSVPNDGFIMAASSHSNDDDVSGNHGGFDYWVVKFDDGGNITWQKSLGGTDADYAEDITPTTDGGYIVAGYSTSTDGDITGNYGEYDYWVVKLASDGSIEWQNSYGGGNDDKAYSIIQTAEGGYMIAGISNSIDGDITSPINVDDFWIVKIDAAGQIEWERSYGGKDNEWMSGNNSIQQTGDGGYIVAGYTSSHNVDVMMNFGSRDYWVIRLDTSGNMLWEKTYGGTHDDQCFSVNLMEDGNFLLAGWSDSRSYQVTTSETDLTFSADYWIVCINENGKIVWEQCYGGNSVDYATASKITSNGGVIITGYSYSNDGDVSMNHGNADYWVVKLKDCIKPLITSDGNELCTSPGLTYQWYLAGDLIPGATGQCYLPVEDGVYSVLVSDSNSCSALSVNYTYSIIGLSSPDLNLFVSVHPNPVSLNTTITVQLEASAKLTIELTDLSGKKLKTLYAGTLPAGVNHLSFARGDLNSGIYLLNIETENTIQTRKLILQ